MTRPKIAVIGAGVIGHTHAELIARTDHAHLASIVEPGHTGRALAARLLVPHFADHHAMLAAGTPDFAIVASPNDTHLPIARDLLRAGVPVLVEKPIASTVADGEAIAAEAETAGLIAMVGHHRRHNPIARAARDAVRGGRLGTLTIGHTLYAFQKHDEYFAPEWRRGIGAGPVLINLIHEIDLIRYIAGEIVSVQAVTSNARRGFEVEDTVAVLLTLEGGVVFTVSLSDCVASPWSWDLTTGENPETFTAPTPNVQTHFFCGTEGSLSLPGMVLWRYGDRKGWHEPLLHGNLPVRRADPYEAQLAHIIRVLAGTEAPVCSAADGARTLRATLAVREAAATGAAVKLPPYSD